MIAASICSLSVRNFKSLRSCDITLGGLNVLVGRNASGKSNVVDCLRFVRDAVDASLNVAVKHRGGMGKVRNWNVGGEASVSIKVGLDAGERGTWTYGLALAGRHQRPLEVQSERLDAGPGAGAAIAFACKDGIVDHALGPDGQGRASHLSVQGHKVATDRLHIADLADSPSARPLVQALRGMRFYQFHPPVMRIPHEHETREALSEDGRDVAGVIHDLPAYRLERLNAYLSAIVPGISRVHVVPTGGYVALEAVGSGGQGKRRFRADSMSDGTLRAIGMLTALFAQSPGNEKHPGMVVIEEPELGLHPAALAALADACREVVAEGVQVVLTSHSPELLDVMGEDATILVVADGPDGTEVGPVRPAMRDVIRRHLATPGELLRQDQLLPTVAPAERSPGEAGPLGKAG